MHVFFQFKGKLFHSQETLSSPTLPDVILGLNSIRLSDAALDNLFFSKTCFNKGSVNML